MKGNTHTLYGSFIVKLPVINTAGRLFFWKVYYLRALTVSMCYYHTTVKCP